MSDPVASKIGRPSSPSMATSAKSYRRGDCRAAMSRASNCRRVNLRGGDSAGTVGGAPSRPSIRPSGSAGRRSSAFVRERHVPAQETK
jgi:hypothetical protein